MVLHPSFAVKKDFAFKNNLMFGQTSNRRSNEETQTMLVWCRRSYETCLELNIKDIIYLLKNYGLNIFFKVILDIPPFCSN